MGASNMILTAANIKTLVDDTANAVADVNTTITEIATKFDAMLETSTGHSHDGTNSASVTSGVGSLTTAQFSHALILGGYV